MRCLVRLALLGLLLLCLPVSGFAQSFSVVGFVRARSGDAVNVTTGALDTTGADLVLEILTYYSVNPVPTLSENKSNTLHPLTAVTTVARGLRVAWFQPGTVGAGHTFTATGDPSGSYPSLLGLAVTGSLASAPLDQEIGASTTVGSSLQAGSLTPSVANTLMVAVLATDVANTATIDSGFTLLDQWNFSGGVGGAVAYKLKTDATAENPTWSWSGSDGNGYAATLVIFKPTAGAPASPPPDHDVRAGVGGVQTGPGARGR